MLTRLDIRDFAVVAHAEFEPGAGLTVISGETGAGKSLLVDALGFLSGQRADSGVVRHGAERAELHAEFDLGDAPGARDWLIAQELDDAGACQLRRTLRADGGSRAWINGRPASIAQLGELAGLLVEIHGQHAQQALLSRQAQLQLLDAYGNYPALLQAVSAAATQWKALLQERERLRNLGDASERLDYLAHQHAELAREDLDATAITEVLAGHRRQAHAAALIEACRSAALNLAGDDGPALGHRLQQVRARLQRVVEHEPRLAEVNALLDAAAIQLDEAAQSLDRIQDDLDMDPERFAQLERQLGRLHDLARKHRVAPEALAERRDAIARELDESRDADARLQALEGDIEQARTHWRKAATALTRAREQAAAALSAAVTGLIGELGMPGGRFEIALQAASDDKPDAHGAERAEFLVSANAGQPPRALRKVASGGELARVSLAIEVAAIGLDAVPTMVFDEVDTGIGGAIAEIVGQKLRALGEERQVLCVTHLPQVAAQGHAHYRVSKAAAGGLTRSEVRALSPDERVEELARMLGGVEVGKEARAAARKLLKGVG